MKNDYDGISLSYSSNNNILKKNNISKNSNGIYLQNSSKNRIYNNIFNNNNNFEILESTNNIWNARKRSGTNIIGGLFLGGNFWGDPDGAGFSQTCKDLNSDGICDKSFILDSKNIDYMPLSIVK